MTTGSRVKNTKINRGSLCRYMSDSRWHSPYSIRIELTSFLIANSNDQIWRFKRTKILGPWKWLSKANEYYCSKQDISEKGDLGNWASTGSTPTQIGKTKCSDGEFQFTIGERHAQNYGCRINGWHNYGPSSPSKVTNNKNKNLWPRKEPYLTFQSFHIIILSKC